MNWRISRKNQKQMFLLVSGGHSQNMAVNTAAEHKGNMREIFYFPVFCNFHSNFHFTQIKNYIFTEQEMKIVSF